jgi:bifunctional non-homologous end joining protein LigD
MLWRTRPGRSSRAPGLFIGPCLPTVADKAPSGPGWVHEIKHDGYRLQIHKRDGRVRLFTRTGIDWTERYPWIVEDVARLRPTSIIIDAEAVCAGPDGVTDFDALHARCREHEVFAYAFDLLQLDGDDLRQQSLAERKAKLEQLAQKMHKLISGGIRYSEHIEGDGETIFAHACKMKLEGIVSKRLNSRYRSGRAKTWIKVKNKLAQASMRVIDGTW